MLSSAAVGCCQSATSAGRQERTRQKARRRRTRADTSRPRRSKIPSGAIRQGSEESPYYGFAGRDRQQLFSDLDEYSANQSIQLVTATTPWRECRSPPGHSAPESASEP